MHKNTRSFADLIIGQREQGMRSEEVCNASGLTQAQRQAVEKLGAGPNQYGICSIGTVEHLMGSQNTLQLSHRGISRRTALLRLAGLVVGGVAGSSLVLLACSQQSTSTLYTYYGNVGRHRFVRAVAWSPDGKRIASGDGSGVVQVWDAADGGHVYTYRGHTDIVYAVAWSPDGKRITSGGLDTTVQVWDAADGGHVYTYRGHSEGVHAVVWSPDGKRIASGSFDATVQVWDAANGGHVFTYRGHSEGVNAVAWSPDGKRIASGSGDNTVQVWVAG